MARRANLSFGSLNPFGGGDLSFGSFNVAPKPSSASGGSTTVDPSKEAYLEFQRVETEYQAGRIDDATYQAAFQTYSGMLDPGTSEAYNAQSRLESMQYTMERDSLVASIRDGRATWTDLVNFDASSLSGLNPGSAEYRDRVGRLYSSQTNEFRTAEKKISDDLDAKRMTYAQALGWYENARGYYGSNFELSSQIGETIGLVENRIVDERDNEILNGWKNNTLSLDALLAYSAVAQAENPGSERAKAWGENSKNATIAAVGSSLQYRYSLTEEYRDLAILVASLKPPTGNSSVSKSFQYYVDANGQWKTKVIYKTKTTGPTPIEQQAYRERKAQADQARIRMTEITKLVGTMPGGWVTEDDILRNLADQQAIMVKGSPGWIDLQKNIDYYNERKRSDEILRKSGVIVSVPTTGSEKTAASNVGSLERPMAPGTGKATVPAPPKAGGGGGGGGSSLSAADVRAVNAAKAGLPTPPKGGFLWEAVKQQKTGFENLVSGQTKGGSKGLFVTGILTAGGPLNVAFRQTGIQGMSSPEFQELYKGMTEAVKEGETTWVNPASGVAYLLPMDPTDRLAILDGLDANNVEQRRVEYLARGTKTTARAYESAIKKANTNDLWVMNAPLPGVPQGTPQLASDEYLAADKGAAPVSAALNYMDRAELEASEWGRAAQKALDQGNIEQAWTYFRLSQASLSSESGLAAQASAWATVAQAGLEVLGGKGAKIPKSGELAQDIKRMQSIGDADPDGAWLTRVMEESGLEEVAKFFTPPADKTKDPFLRNKETGQPLVNDDGTFKLGQGWVRMLVGDNKMELKQLPLTFNRLTNKMESADPTMVLVQLQTETGFEPVMAPFKLEDVGLLVDANGQNSAITSKVVRINWNGQSYIMAQDPMDPRRWVTMTDNGMTFNLPKGATVMKGSSKLGTTGSQVAFTGTNVEGKKTKYVLAQDENGTYGIYTTDTAGNFTGEVIEVGSVAATDLLTGAGIGLDLSQLSAGQRTYLNSGLVGVWVGDEHRIATAAAQRRFQLYGPPATPWSPSTRTGGGYGGMGQPSSLGSQLPRGTPTTTPGVTRPILPRSGPLESDTPPPPWPYVAPSSLTQVPKTTAPPYVAPSSLTQVPKTRPTTVISPVTGFTLPVAPPYVAPSSLTQVPKTRPTTVISPVTGFTLPKPLPVIKPPPIAVGGKKIPSATI